MDQDHKESSSGKCKKCGLCCIIEVKPGKWKFCKYLYKRQTKGRMTCIIYPNRLGVDLGHGYICGLRKNLKFNIPGCPYNKKTYKPHPAYNFD